MTTHPASIALSGDLLDQLKQLAIDYQTRDENEADTRHRIIDIILHEILAWPRNRVSVEEYIKPGFADYVLRKQNDDALIFVEAKKAGIFFAVPHAYDEHETSS